VQIDGDQPHRPLAPVQGFFQQRALWHDPALEGGMVNGHTTFRHQFFNGLRCIPRPALRPRPAPRVDALSIVAIFMLRQGLRRSLGQPGEQGSPRGGDQSAYHAAVPAMFHTTLYFSLLSRLGALVSRSAWSCMVSERSAPPPAGGVAMRVLRTTADPAPRRV
jgi:hypothetical protein